MSKKVLFLAFSVVLAVALAPAQCQTAGMTLFLQQSPFEGGIVTPSPGVYLFNPDSQIELTAVPKPGYRFVCWLGDVGDATANSTVTYLNAPKVIVAVFERCGYEDVYGGGAGGGVNTTEDIGGSVPHYSSGGGGYNPPSNPPDEPPSDPPNDPPPNVPTPEPTTILLLGSGCLMLLRKRRA